MSDPVRITEIFTNSRAWNIPAGAINIQYIIRGGRGGHAGATPRYNGNYYDYCWGKGGMFGAQGQYLSGTMPDTMAGQTINWIQGRKGVDNDPVTGGAFDAGTGGGTGYHNGGSGGYAPDSTASGEYVCSHGGGAGGGGSSAFLTSNNTLMVEAGGGGGAGGAGIWFFGASTGYYNNPDYFNAATTEYRGTGYTNTAPNQNPSYDSNWPNGWFTRTGVQRSNPLQGVRTLVLKWDGDVIYEGPVASDDVRVVTVADPPWTSNPYIVIGGYAYSTWNYTGSQYGWCGDDSQGVCTNPIGDQCNAFDISRKQLPGLSYSSGTYGSGDPKYRNGVTVNDNGSNGGTGGYASASQNNGGGGGGGGNPGGDGGVDNLAGNQVPGYPGKGGKGYYNSTYITTCTSTYHGYENWETQTFVDDGYAEISYELQPDPVASLTTTATDINRGEEITLSWSSSNGVTFSLTDQNGDVVVADPGASDTYTFKPLPGTWTYTYSVTNDLGTSTADVEVTVTLLAPTVTLESANNVTSVINPGCVDLTWSTTGEDITSYSLTNYNDPGDGGTDTFCPTTTTTYIYSATNDAGTATAEITITVYQPPVLTLTADDTSLVAGGTTTIRWSTTGDGDTITWVLGDISSVDTTGDQQVQLGDTITYSAYVSGLGGTSPTVSVTVVVHQVPTIDTFSVTAIIDYLASGQIQYSYTYANIEAKLDVTYYYGTDAFPQPTINLDPSDSSQLNAAGITVSDTINPYNITWTEFGPSSIGYTLSVVGDGGSITATGTSEVNADRLPEAFVIEDSDNKIAEEVAYSIDVAPEEVVLSDLYKIEDIEVPVEIKSDYEIQVKINNAGQWNNVRELDE